MHNLTRSIFAITLFLTFALPALADVDLGAEAFNRGDFKTAFREWLPDAEQGNSMAQFNLGVLYILPGGGSRRILKKHFSGFPSQQIRVMPRLSSISARHIPGVGVSRNRAEAIGWYRLAADQGHADAQYHLGLLFASMESVSENFSRAARWYLLAAAQGHAMAQFNLGVLYLNGTGVGQNPQQAAEYFRLAAERGADKAQFNLGLMYAMGVGVEENFMLAYKWLSIAADRGHDEAVNRMNLIEDMMTAMEISQGKQRAEDWLEQNRNR